MKKGLCAVPETGHCLPLIKIGGELVKRGYNVIFVSTNEGKKTNLQKMVEDARIKIIFTNDKFLIKIYSWYL